MKRSLRAIGALLLCAMMLGTVLMGCDGEDLPVDTSAETYDGTESNASDNEQGDNEQGDVEQGDNEQGDVEQGDGEQGDDEMNINSLDGKKIIFIGNSYTYYGQTVLEKSQTYLTQASRTGDKGYFYQLCKANGMDVEVTNWTFGGHSLEHMFGGNCSANRGCDGVDHKAYITDRNFDYVVIQTGSSEAADASFSSNLENVMAFFREANPNVRFAIIVPYNAYGTIGSQMCLAKNTLDSLKSWEDKGVTIIEWGRLVYDIMNGDVQVPDAECEYEKNTFVIKKSAKDGYHPNQLSGYITTLMTYCAFTGASAQGQTYGFCNNSALRPAGASAKFYSFSKFISTYYTYDGATTNYTDVFASDADMAGIQALIDKYLEEKPYRSYDYASSDESTGIDSDSEAVAAGYVAKLLNNGTESYLTLDALEEKITGGYTNGDCITLLTDVTCKGATSGNMRKTKTVTVTLDLNAKTLTLTNGSLMRTTYKDGYVSTFNLISSNGKGTVTLPAGNKYTVFQMYGNNKNVLIGSEVGYTDGDCVVINCTNFLYTSTYWANDASTTSLKMYGGEVNKIGTDGEEDFIRLLGRGFSDTKNYSYYYGKVEFVGVKISQKVETDEPLFSISYSNDNATYTAEYLPAECKDASGLMLTDCEIVGYSSSALIHNAETLNAKITYNNCRITGDIGTVGSDATDKGLGKIILGVGTTFTMQDASIIKAYDRGAITTYTEAASGIYTAENAHIVASEGGYKVC
ncbi:MAG: hypothetical protein IJ011_06735 [Clostridia bacterium]|nr:hypothetical protein [Clostridia bacterium]